MDCDNSVGGTAHELHVQLGLTVPSLQKILPLLAQTLDTPPWLEQQPPHAWLMTGSKTVLDRTSDVIEMFGGEPSSAANGTVETNEQSNDVQTAPIALIAFSAKNFRIDLIRLLFLHCPYCIPLRN